MLEGSSKAIALPSADLPVLARTDVVVAGASFAGCAAALACARAGLKVWITDSRTYPGRELTATLRPWMPAAVLEQPPALLAGWIGAAAGTPDRNGEVPLHPDRVKRGLEDVLLAAGVQWLYLSQSVGVVREGDRVAGLVVGNKSGRQCLLGSMVVDATGDHWFDAIDGRPQAPVKSLRAFRTLEFTHAGEIPDGGVHPPADLGVEVVRIHQGFLGSGHWLVECGLGSPAGRDPTARELEARRKTFALAAWMMANPLRGRRGARFATASPELATAVGPARIESPLAGLVRLIPGEPATRPEELASSVDAGEKAGMATITCAKESGSADVSRCLAWCGSQANPGSHSALRGGQSGVTGHLLVNQSVRAPAVDIPVVAEGGVVIAGGGTSGAVAAAVAAGEGVPTLLLEAQAGLGGTGTLGGVDSYWFGRRVGYTAELDRRYGALAGAVGERDSGKWNIEARMQAQAEWAADSGAAIRFRAMTVGALLDGPAVKGVLVATPDGLVAALADAVVDATGDGDVAAHTGAAFVYGSGRDRMPMWYALCPHEEPGRPMNNFTSTVDVTNPEDLTRAILAGRRRWDGYDHAVYLAPRETRHIRGGVTLGLTDQLLLRRFPDTINVCSANSDLKGKTGSDWVAWGVLPPNCEMDVPYRAVVPEVLDGLLVAGKAYSATHDYLAGARMQADMQNQGGACGLAAALAVTSKTRPRDLDVGMLRRRLVEAGVLPADRLAAPEVAVPTGHELRELIAGLTGSEPFHLDQGFADRITEPLTVVRLASAGPQVVPWLEEAHAGCTGPRRLLLARLLAWHGSRLGVPDLVKAILEALADGHLPGPTRRIGYAGVPPDHGVMPEPCYLMHALALAPDQRAVLVLARVAELYDATEDDYRDKLKSPFHYVDEVAAIAERLGTREAGYAANLLWQHPTLHGLVARSPEADFFRERRACLELGLGRAMARCGRPEGYAILQRFTLDCRSCLAVHAREELERLTGHPSSDTPAINRWLFERTGHLPLIAWTSRLD